MSHDLNDMEAEAVRMIEFFQEECRKQCAPYVKIICEVRALRPRTYTVDGKTVIPIANLLPDVKL